MILNFEKGKYYRFTSSTRGSNWNSEGYMDGVMSGKPLLCTGAGKNFNASFEGIRVPGEVVDYQWSWNDESIRFWEEVYHPGYEIPQFESPISGQTLKMKMNFSPDVLRVLHEAQKISMEEELCKVMWREDIDKHPFRWDKPFSDTTLKHKRRKINWVIGD